MRRWMGAVALLAAGCREPVQHGLEERAANEVQAALVERGFAARKRNEGGRRPTWAVEVSADQAGEAVRALHQLGLPRPRGPSSDELLSSAGLVPTPGEERQRHLLGLAGDLARTLESIDGVAAARVHLAVPAPPRPGSSGVAAKASAFLRVRAGAMEKVGRQRDAVRALIAGSVEALAVEGVTLVLSEEALWPAPRSEGAPVRQALGWGALALFGVAFGAAGWAVRRARRRAPAPPVLSRGR
jgi:type III secretion protein J